jgi:acyl-[acyl-carrier-protein]-phospholipid O-acyltransferase/long-chain-fatty-acid--[acyl-carrier-protein] ligase
LSDASRPEPTSPGFWGFVLRAWIRLLTWTVYRVRVLGAANLPRTGAVLLAPNHVSFVDALFLLTTFGRPVRFVVESAYYHHPLLRPFMKALQCIPISASGGPRQMLRALRDAGEHLDRGEVVCIFPEGQLTRTGMLLPFRRGMARLARGRDAVILPVYMDRVWGSIFSRERGRYLFKWPKEFPYPVTVAYGKPLPPDTPVADVRRAVQELSVEAWSVRKSARPPLHHTARRALRRRFHRVALADGTRGEVSGIAALTGAIAIARELRAEWKGQERVGILLPPSVGGVLVNLAAAFAGRVTVNLNYTSGRAGMESAARQSGLRTVVTSRAFLERAKVEVPPGVEPIWADELRERIGPWKRRWAALLAVLAPVRWIELACGAERRTTVADAATVIFSSGSTGEPKGIVLSHFNVDCNVEAAAQIVRLERHDRVMEVLPLFHSFGNFLLWLGLGQGVPLVLHVSPLDAEGVGALVERHRATILLATPTFLQLYLRRCAPGQFGSLRLIVTGAEKLPARLRDSFHDGFGIEPLEGYGTTECAPAVSVCVPDFRAPGFFQPGSRRGSVGQPLPGVAVRIVDPDTFEPKAPESSGLLLVKGPNVMQGYLGRPDLTEKALHDGWYVTGDIGVVDEEGFLWITDRLARFSKIGGEMVPHGRVEEALHQAAGVREGQVFAVTSVPDVRKGERLAVVHTIEPTRIPAVLAGIASMGLPNLFVPRAQDFVRAAEIPLLGTGKADLRRIRRIAEEALAGTGEEGFGTAVERDDDATGATD